MRDANDSADVTGEIPLHDPVFKMIRDLHIKDVGKQIAETLGMLRDERAVRFIYYNHNTLYSSTLFLYVNQLRFLRTSSYLCKHYCKYHV